MTRDIFHINVTAFPIGVERVIDSSLRDRPVVIAAINSPRPIVLAMSREAYLEGVMKGMPVSSARKFCRGIMAIPPNEPLYRKASRDVQHAHHHPVVVGILREGLLLPDHGRLFGRPHG